MDSPIIRFITPKDGQGTLVVLKEDDYLALLEKLELYEALLKGMADLDEELETMQQMDVPAVRYRVRGHG